jgi:protein TonB
MLQLLKIIGLPGILIAFVLLTIMSIYFINKVLHKEQRHSLRKHPGDNVLMKKYPGVDIANYRSMIYRLGLIISLIFTFSVFEFPFYEEASLVQLTGQMTEIDEMFEVPPTEQVQPPPPVVKSPQIIAVDDEKIIEYEIEINLDMEADEELVIAETEEIILEEVEQEEEEKPDEIFMIVEEPAEPKGGYSEFYAYVSKEMNYPMKALEVSASGKVYIKFVVDKDGALTDLEIARGIGFGCDEEAIRVLSQAPKWTPAKQRGRVVKQQMVIPIFFKLADM